MNLVLTRIDNRLIHGQVLESWIPFVQADCIVVANDAIATNQLKKMMMQASVPSKIRVEIGTVADTVILLKTALLNKQKILLLFGTPADAVRAYHAGLKFTKLNLGNLHADKWQAQLSCTLFLDALDLADLELLDGAGIKITSRCIPADSERSWRKLIPAGKSWY